MDIKLIDFDQDFYSSIKDSKDICISSKGFYNTILVENESAGIIGFIPSKLPYSGFFQILLHPNFRGMGVLDFVLDFFVEKYSLKILYATIKKDNLSSIWAHKRIGFEEVSKKDMEFLRKNDFLNNDEVRFFKEF